MEYPRPQRDSGIGIHLNTNAWFVLGEVEPDWPRHCQMLVDMGLSWVKVITTGNNLLSAIRTFEYQGHRNLYAEYGLMPIVRFYWSNPYPVSVNAELLNNIREATRRFMDKGVVYFEVENEPNLLDEWQSKAAWHQYDAPEARPNHAADVWIEKAAAVAEVGGIPLLTALAPGGHHDDEDMFPRMVQRLHDRQAHDLLRKSAIAVHNYWLKHPIDFPFDAINRAEHGNVNLHSGRGMSNGFLKFKYVREVVERVTGVSLPVLTTEGGQRIADPTPDFRYWQDITLDVHKESVLQQADYMATQAPEWYFCTNDWVIASKEWGGDILWDWAAWISPVRNPTHAPAIDALKQRGFVPRNVQPEPPPPPPPSDLPAFLTDVVDTLPRHATLRYQKRTKPIDTIVIHHTATGFETTVEAIARYHIQPDPARDKAAWPGIGYHVVIAADGAAYLTNRLDTLSFHTFGHNDHTCAVCFIGDFTRMEPTAAQLATGRKVLDWLYEKLNLGPENVTGHGNLSSGTQCPGGDWWRRMLADEGGLPEPALADVRHARFWAEELTRRVEAELRDLDSTTARVEKVLTELTEHRLALVEMRVRLRQDVTRKLYDAEGIPDPAGGDG